MGLRERLRQLVKPSIVKLCSRPPAMSGLCWRVDTREQRVALTFDDGPHPEHTPPVLDILGEQALHATFFVLGEQIERYGEIFERIVREGHHIGNHGYDHSIEDLPGQIVRTDEILGRLRIHTRFFRPPYGAINPKVLLWTMWHGYSTVIWSHDSRDSLRDQGKRSAGQASDEVAPGDIVLMHDDNLTCHRELRGFLDVARQKGLELGTLPQLMDARRPLWQHERDA